MEPKKDAIELIQRFRLLQGSSQDEDGGVVNNYNISKHNAKQCATIHVDCLIAENESVFKMLRLHGFDRNRIPVQNRISYLQSVKTEIEKL